MVEKQRLSSCTDFVIVTYFVIFSIALFTTLAFLVFAENFDWHSWILIVLCVPAGVLIWTILVGIRKLFDRISVNKDESKLVQTQMEMLWGLGGVMVCTMVPRIAVFFCTDNVRLFFFIVTISLITAFLFHYLFTYGYNQHCEYNSWNRLPVPTFIVFFAQIASIFMARRASEEYKERSEQGMIMMTQLAFLVLSTVSSMEYCMVWNGNLAWRGWSKRRRETTEKPANPESFTLCLIPLCQCVSVLLAIILIALRIRDHLSWTTVFVMIGISMAIVVVMLLIGGTLRWYMDKKKYIHLKKYKTEVSLGLGLMVFSTLVPRVMVYFWPLDMQILLPCLFISQSSALSAYGIFVCFSDRWILKYRNHLKCVASVGLLQFFATCISVRIALFYENFQETESILYVQLGLMFLTYTGMSDFVVIMMGGMELKPKKKSFELQTVKTVDESGNEPQSMFQSHECKICILEFNETIRIPRMLRECGHTVCEPCANVLLKKTNGDILTCPFCQSITIVRGNSNLLPKNFGMLEIIEEHKSGLKNQELSV